MANNITTQITITAKDMASNVFKNVGDNIKSTGGNIKTFVADNMQAGGIAAAGLAASVALVARNAITMAANFEQSEIAFTTLLKDRKKAIAAIKEIEKDAKSTPYNLPDLIRANQLLISAGVSTGDARNQIKALGNAIAATGGGTAELNRLSANLQQIKAVGKASALDIKQFAYAGINVYQMLADVTGKNVKEVKEMDVSYELLTQAFEKASQKGGMFAGAMENQSKSFQGLMANIQDVIGLSLKDIAVQSGLFDVVKDAAQNFLKALEAGTPLVVNFMKSISENKSALTAIAGALGGLVVLIGAVFISTFGGAIVIMTAFMAAGAGIAIAIKEMSNWFNGGSAIALKFSETLSRGLLFVEEKMKPIIRTIKDALIPAFQQLFEALKPALMGLAVIFGAFASVAIALLAGLVKGFAMSIPFIINIISGLVTVFAGAINLITALFTGRLGELPAIVSQIALGILQTIVGVFGSIITFVWGFVTGIVQFFQWMYNIIVGNSIVPDMVNAILQWFNMLLSIGSSIFKTIFNVITNIVDALKTHVLFKAIELVVGVISFFQQLPGQVASIFNNMYQMASNIINSMKNSVINIFDSMKNAVVNAVNNMYNTAVGVFNSLLNAATSIFNSIRNAVSSAIQSARDALVSNVNGWAGAFQSAISSIPGIVSGIFGQIGGIIGGALSNAYNIAVGWLNSLREIWNSIIQGANNAMNAASGSTSSNSTSTQSLSTLGGAGSFSKMSSLNTIPETKPETSITFTVNIGMYAGSETEKRNIAQELFKSLEIVAHSQSKTVGELLNI